MTKPPRRRRFKFKTGMAVVAYAGTLPGVGPMDKLLITAVHKDGTVDVAVVRHEWLRVDPEPLLELS